MIDLCLLGCGGMMPLRERNLTSLLIRAFGRMILIDCGEGTQVPVRMSGWGFASIDTILFTHYHADHIAGLPGLLLAMGNSGRTGPVDLFGPPGLTDVVKGLTVIAPVLPFELNCIELSAASQSYERAGELIVESLPAEHTVPCLAYSIRLNRSGRFDTEKAERNHVPKALWSRLQRGEPIHFEGEVYGPEAVLGEPRKGLKVTYCTDSRPSEELACFARDSDILILEGMYGSDEFASKAAEKKHMLFSEAARIAAKSNSKELWLTHYSPQLKDPEEYLRGTREIFPDTYAGYGLMKKTLRFDTEA
jgi:ribonuclease Z